MQTRKPRSVWVWLLFLVVCGMVRPNLFSFGYLCFAGLFCIYYGSVMERTLGGTRKAIGFITIYAGLITIIQLIAQIVFERDSTYGVNCMDDDDGMSQANKALCIIGIPKVDDSLWTITTAMDLMIFVTSLILLYYVRIVVRRHKESTFVADSKKLKKISTKWWYDYATLILMLAGSAMIPSLLSWPYFAILSILLVVRVFHKKELSHKAIYNFHLVCFVYTFFQLLVIYTSFFPQGLKYESIGLRFHDTNIGFFEYCYNMSTLGIFLVLELMNGLGVIHKRYLRTENGDRDHFMLPTRSQTQQCEEFASQLEELENEDDKRVLAEKRRGALKVNLLMKRIGLFFGTGLLLTIGLQEHSTIAFSFIIFCFLSFIAPKAFLKLLPVIVLLASMYALGRYTVAVLIELGAFEETETMREIGFTKLDNMVSWWPVSSPIIAAFLLINYWKHRHLVGKLEELEKLTKQAQSYKLGRFLRSAFIEYRCMMYISLLLTYCCALGAPHPFDFLYLAFFVCFTLSRRIARKLWIFLTCYAELYVLTAFWWRFSFAGFFSTFIKDVFEPVLTNEERTDMEATFSEDSLFSLLFVPVLLVIGTTLQTRLFWKSLREGHNNNKYEGDSKEIDAKIESDNLSEIKNGGVEEINSNFSYANENFGIQADKINDSDSSNDGIEESKIEDSELKEEHDADTDILSEVKPSTDRVDDVTEPSVGMYVFHEGKAVSARDSVTKRVLNGLKITDTTQADSLMDNNGKSVPMPPEYSPPCANRHASVGRLSAVTFEGSTGGGRPYANTKESIFSIESADSTHGIDGDSSLTQRSRRSRASSRLSVVLNPLKRVVTATPHVWMHVGQLVHSQVFERIVKIAFNNIVLRSTGFMSLVFLISYQIYDRPTSLLSLSYFFGLWFLSVFPLCTGPKRWRPILNVQLSIFAMLASVWGVLQFLVTFNVFMEDSGLRIAADDSCEKDISWECMKSLHRIGLHRNRINDATLEWWMTLHFAIMTLCVLLRHNQPQDKEIQDEKKKYLGDPKTILALGVKLVHRYSSRMNLILMSIFAINYVSILGFVTLLLALSGMLKGIVRKFMWVLVLLVFPLVGMVEIAANTALLETVLSHDQSLLAGFVDADDHDQFFKTIVMYMVWFTVFACLQGASHRWAHEVETDNLSQTQNEFTTDTPPDALASDDESDTLTMTGNSTSGSVTGGGLRRNSIFKRKAQAVKDSLNQQRRLVSKSVKEVLNVVLFTSSVKRLVSKRKSQRLLKDKSEGNNNNNVNDDGDVDSIDPQKRGLTIRFVVGIWRFVEFWKAVLVEGSYELSVLGLVSAAIFRANAVSIFYIACVLIAVCCRRRILHRVGVWRLMTFFVFGIVLFQYVVMLLGFYDCYGDCNDDIVDHNLRMFMSWQKNWLNLRNPWVLCIEIAALFLLGFHGDSYKSTQHDAKLGHPDRWKLEVMKLRLLNSHYSRKMREIVRHSERKASRTDISRRSGAYHVLMFILLTFLMAFGTWQFNIFSLGYLMIGLGMAFINTPGLFMTYSHLWTKVLVYNMFTICVRTIYQLPSFDDCGSETSLLQLFGLQKISSHNDCGGVWVENRPNTLVLDIIIFACLILQRRLSWLPAYKMVQSHLKRMYRRTFRQGKLIREDLERKRDDSLAEIDGYVMDLRKHLQTVGSNYQQALREHNEKKEEFNQFVRGTTPDHVASHMVESMIDHQDEEIVEIKRNQLKKKPLNRIASSSVLPTDADRRAHQRMKKARASIGDIRVGNEEVNDVEDNNLPGALSARVRADDTRTNEEVIAMAVEFKKMGENMKKQKEGLDLTQVQPSRRSSDPPAVIPKIRTFQQGVSIDPSAGQVRDRGLSVDTARRALELTAIPEEEDEELNTPVAFDDIDDPCSAPGLNGSSCLIHETSLTPRSGAQSINDDDHDDDVDLMDDNSTVVDVTPLPSHTNSGNSNKNTITDTTTVSSVSVSTTHTLAPPTVIPPNSRTISISSVNSASSSADRVITPKSLGSISPSHRIKLKNFALAKNWESNGNMEDHTTVTSPTAAPNAVSSSVETEIPDNNDDATSEIRDVSPAETHRSKSSALVDAASELLKSDNNGEINDDTTKTTPPRSRPTSKRLGLKMLKEGEGSFRNKKEDPHHPHHHHHHKNKLNLDMRKLERENSMSGSRRSLPTTGRSLWGKAKNQLVGNEENTARRKSMMLSPRAGGLPIPNEHTATLRSARPKFGSSASFRIISGYQSVVEAAMEQKREEHRQQHHGHRHNDHHHHQPQQTHRTMGTTASSGIHSHLSPNSGFATPRTMDTASTGVSTPKKSRWQSIRRKSTMFFATKKAALTNKIMNDQLQVEESNSDEEDAKQKALEREMKQKQKLKQQQQEQQEQEQIHSGVTPEKNGRFRNAARSSVAMLSSFGRAMRTGPPPLPPRPSDRNITSDTSQNADGSVGITPVTITSPNGDEITNDFDSHHHQRVGSEVSQQSVSELMTARSRNENLDATRKEPESEGLSFRWFFTLAGIIYQIVDTNTIFCVYGAMILAHIMEMNLLSVFYPLIVFGFCLLQNPRQLPNIASFGGLHPMVQNPPKELWIIVGAYCCLVMAVKFLFQLDVFCICHPLGVNASGDGYFSVYPECWKSSLDVGESQVCGHPDEAVNSIGDIWGLRKFDTDGSGSFTNDLFGFLWGCGWDMIVLITVLWHTQHLKKKGVWKSRLPQKEVTEDLKMLIKGNGKKEMKDSKFLQVLSDTENESVVDLDKLEAGTANRDIYSETREISRLAKIWKNERGGWNVFRWGLRREFLLITRPTCISDNWNDRVKPGHDFYVYSFIVQMFLIIDIAFFINNHENMASGVQDNRLTSELVYMLLAQFIIMILDRVVYLRRQLHWKFILHFVNVGLCFGIAYKPVDTRVFIWFLLQQCYLFISALQICYGHPLFVGTQFLMRSIHWIWGYVFYAYKSIPFLYEMRTILDWTCTKTTLYLYEFFKFEDIYTSLFVVACDLHFRLDDNRRVGEAQPLYRKILAGMVSFTGLLALIWLPLIIFSTDNAMSTNAVGIVEFKASVENYPVFYQSAGIPFDIPSGGAFCLDSELIQPNTACIDNLDVDDITSDFIDYVAEYVSLPYASPYIWSLSEPARQELVDTLTQRKANNEDVYVIFTFEVTYNTLDTNSFYSSVAIEDIDSLIEVVKGNGGSAILGKAMPLAFSTDMNQDPEAVSNGKQTCAVVGNAGDPHLNLICRPTEAGIATSRTKCLAGEAEYCYGSAIYTFTSDYLEENLIMSTGGIIGLYITVVFSVGKFVRLALSGLKRDTFYEDLPETKVLMDMCLDVYFARMLATAKSKSSPLKLEEEMYRAIIDIYRLPQEIYNRTGPYRHWHNLEDDSSDDDDSDNFLISSTDDLENSSDFDEPFLRN